MKTYVDVSGQFLIRPPRASSGPGETFFCPLSHPYRTEQERTDRQTDCQLQGDLGLE